MEDLLFVYGSLLSSDNKFAAYLNRNSTLVGAGKFTGKLYDIGEYPGAILDNNKGYPITGSICKLKNPIETLKILDDYEGFGDDQDQPNLFIRKSLAIESLNGPTNCWIYLYNLPVSEKIEIISGNYLGYLAKKSL